MDIKILAKVLADCLNSVITALIHPDQPHADRALEGSLGMVVSLDAEKAFYS